VQSLVWIPEGTLADGNNAADVTSIDNTKLPYMARETDEMLTLSNSPASQQP